MAAVRWVQGRQSIEVDYYYYSKSRRRGGILGRLYGLWSNGCFKKKSLFVIQKERCLSVGFRTEGEVPIGWSSYRSST